MSSKADICNLALGHIYAGSGISNFDTDQSEAARACRLFYDPCRRMVLRGFDWSFASRFRELSLVDDDSPLEDLGNEWAYQYAYPSTCLKVRRILSGARTDTNTTRAAYKIMDMDAGKMIFTDTAEAVAEVTQDIEETGRFDEDFVLALSYRLGAMLAPRLAGGDKQKIGAYCLAMYKETLSQALGAAIQEENPDDIQYGDLFDAR